MKLKAWALAAALVLTPAAAWAADMAMDCCKDCACCKDKDAEQPQPAPQDPAGG